MLPTGSGLWCLSEPAAFDIARQMRDPNRKPLPSIPVKAKKLASARTSGNRAAYIAGLSIDGPIMPYGNSGWGGTSCEQFGAEFSRAIADPSVSSVLIIVNSPGGQVEGVEELADIIYRGRQVKPVVAISRYMAASAALWLASQATRFYCSPSAEAGSIGCYCLHVDYSAAIAAEGLKVSVISSSPEKVETAPFSPLSDDARTALQKSVDKVALDFQQAVARGRGVTLQRVQSAFGKGRMLNADQAAAVKLTDGTRTIEDVIAGLVAGNGKYAEAPSAEITLLRAQHEAAKAASARLLAPPIPAAWPRRRFRRRTP